MQRGLTQAQLSQSLGMERSALAKIESGQRRVSALELADIARELGRRLEWFVLPRPTAVAQHRGDRTPEWVSSEIDVVLEQAVADVALLTELGHLQVPGRPVILPRPQSVREAEDLASTARLHCGLESGVAVGDLAGVVLAVGLLPFAEPLDGGADAASTSNGSWGVAVINSSNQVGRRRLALAHELGHFLVNDGYVEDFRVDAVATVNQHEARMDRFARAFLLPESAVRDRWERLSDSGVRHAAVLIGSEYRVDMSTLARRLHGDLGLIDAATVDDVRRTRTNQADIVENNLYVPHDLEGTSVPAEYTKAVLRAYRADDITSGRALSLLRGTFTVDDLPQLPVVGEGALWALSQ